MSGPSLQKLESHRSIHQGVISEGRDLLELLIKVQGEKRIDHAMMAAEALIEHWETRLLAHADAEEEGFYEELLVHHPKWRERLTMLKRDHQLFRKIIMEIKEEMATKGITEEAIDRFKAIKVLANIHNEEEETFLFE